MSSAAASFGCLPSRASQLKPCVCRLKNPPKKRSSRKHAPFLPPRPENPPLARARRALASRSIEDRKTPLAVAPAGPRDCRKAALSTLLAARSVAAGAQASRGDGLKAVLVASEAL